MPRAAHPGEKRVVQRGGAVAAGPGACLLPQLLPDGAVPSAAQRGWRLGGMGGKEQTPEERKQDCSEEHSPWLLPLGGAFCVGRCQPGQLQRASGSGGGGGSPLLFSAVLQFAC